jgi:MGT family glycosyltransferase
VIKELIARGESVTYLAPEWCRELVKRSGADFVPYQSFIMGARPKRIDGFAGAQIPLFWAQEILTATPDILRILEQIKPDIVIYDAFTFSAYFAAKILRIPAMRADTSYVTSEHFNYYERTASGSLKGTMFTAETLRQFDELLAPFFARYHLPPQTLLDMVKSRAECDIVFVPSQFHPNASAFDDSTHFVGLCKDPEARPAGTKPSVPENAHSATVFVSLGTIFHFQPALYNMCVEAFGDRDLGVILCIGSLVTADSLGEIPSNIWVGPEVDQLDVLSRADVFITHGGMGSTLEALSLGVPILCIPQYPEQVVTAERISELHLGLHLDRDDVSIRTLKDGVHTLLHDPTYRAAVKSFAATITESGGVPRACDVIEDFRRRHTSASGKPATLPFQARAGERSARPSQSDQT